jgi:phenylalanyl-tRNA synthetase beta chain
LRIAEAEICNLQSAIYHTFAVKYHQFIIMKISYNWLKRYGDFSLPPEEIARLLTNCGLEVEDYEKSESVKGGLKGVFIGLVAECEKHPNADKLSLTKVDIGTGRLLSIVCGAPNVAAGQKVPVATVGTFLYSGDKSFEIKEAKIRGEFSEGMICAEDELGLGHSHEGIMVLDPGTRIGMPAAEYFQLSEDYIFEIGLTPNRTDAMSHTGVARDLAAVLNRHDKSGNYRLKWPSVDNFQVDNHDLEIPVIVKDPEACPRYSGVTITGVKIAESPSWLKNLLSAAGIRPISNVVDVTNFIMLELGQPLHAFDASKIKGRKVVVRKARHEEPFTTLDEVERKLSAADLMICNAEEGMCIAGVFGGADSGVTEKTTELFLESAHFNPRSIRKTSRYHGLQTDSSFRFERGSDPNITVYALKRACMLIKELAGGKISSEIVDSYPNPVEPLKIQVRWKNINRLIGKEIDHDTIKSILSDLGIQNENESAETLIFVIPSYKTDVTREADVIEEILRIYGYDFIEMPGQLRSSLSFSNKPDPEKIRNLVSDYLSSRGFFEIMNNSLTKSRYVEESGYLNNENSVNLLNPLSADLNVMRQSLLFGGLETIAYNQNRKTADLRLYEFGRTYQYFSGRKTPGQNLSPYSEHENLALWITGRQEAESWRTKNDKADFFNIKAAVHDIFLRLGFNTDWFEKTQFSDDLFEEGLSYNFKNETLVRFGTLKKRELKRFDLKQEVFYADFEWERIIWLVADLKVSYKEVPKFPEVRRDLALVLDQVVTYEEIERAAYQAEKKILRGVSLFDIYQGEKIGPGKKSYAISFLLGDEEKTLTDEIIEKTMDRILKALQEKFNAAIR